MLQQFRHVPVGRNQVRFPVLSALPIAYWVGGDTGLKQTTEMNWANKFMNIEEIAVIVPVPDNVLADVDANIWDEAMPFLTEAVGRTLDSAVFFGVNAPGTFPTNIRAAALAAGNTVTEGTDTTPAKYMGDIDSLIGTVEDDGFDVSGWVAARSFRRKLRGARDTLGQKLDRERLSSDLSSIDGDTISYPMRGLWPSDGGAGTNTRAFAGDFNEFVVGIRKDITFDTSQEAVIQDNTGAIVYNAFQQDLTFLRLTFRAGWQVSNRINHDQPTETDRYPVGALVY